MKKLIFFAKHMEIGGLEKALLNLLNGIDHDRFQVTLVLEEARGAFLEELDRRVRVEEYRLSACRFVPLRKAIHFSKRMLWALKNHKQYDFSCSYCTYSVIGSRLAQYASENNCLYVHTDYSSVYPDKDSFRAFYDRLGVRNFRHLVFVSENSRRNFRNFYPELTERGTVINNVVDAEGIRRCAQEEAAPCVSPGETAFAFVGRLEEETKRLSRLLDGFALACKARKDIRLLIIGDGPDRSLCEDKIARYDLAGRVTMLGRQTNPYKYMAQADCIILCSDQEGFPMVYYEALLLKKDIITTIPVEDELLDISDYSIVTEKTAEAVARAMIAYRRTEPRCPDVESLNRARLSHLRALFEDGGCREG